MTTWQQVAKNHFRAEVHGHTLEVYLDEGELGEGPSWVWQAVEPDGSLETGDADSRTEAMDAAILYASPPEPTPTKPATPRMCSECGEPLTTESERAYGNHAACWNKPYR